ncbi:unnamed protein product [Sphagnum troendelagicum]|uniref:Uncharacterized protein n=1 Tax=Sphagnum troendelagicum TaxID=128251 RepID=A0ABP0U2X5_9BRYO
MSNGFNAYVTICIPSVDLQAGIRSTTSTTALLGFLLAVVTVVTFVSFSVVELC